MAPNAMGHCLSTLNIVGVFEGMVLVLVEMLKG